MKVKPISALVRDSATVQDPCDYATKYDVILLCNILDRTPLPISLLRTALNCLKPGGVVILSVSMPWRPAYSDKIQHPARVKTENEQGMRLFREARYMISDNFIQPLPKCLADKGIRGYPWFSPPEIPPTFEEALGQVRVLDS